MKLFISPPFGNYTTCIKYMKFCNRHYEIVPIFGSYTIYPRKGLVLQTIKTLRYRSDLNGWTNRIGLRNKGLVHGIEHYNYMKSVNIHGIVSIAITDIESIPMITKLVDPKIPIEINISCPNINISTSKNNIRKMLDFGLQDFATQYQSNQKSWCSIKLPHRCSLNIVDMLYEAGFRQFHCSNTKNTEYGGLSGPSLREINMSTISDMDRRYCGELEIVGGGGVLTSTHIEQYRWAGAEHVSVSTVMMNPINLHRLFLK